MLQRNVKIGQHLCIATCHERDKFIGIMGGMRVKQPDDKFSLKFIQRFQQMSQRFPRLRPIQPIGGDILGDYQQFPDAGRDQIARLGDDGGDRPAPQLPADIRNTAISAAVVTAVGDLEICQVRQRQLETWRVFVVEISRFCSRGKGRGGGIDQFGDFSDLIDAGPEINLRIFAAESILPIPLRQASGNQDFPLRLPFFKRDMGGNR